MDERTQQTPDESDLNRSASAWHWALVIAYHPDTERIGERWSGSRDETLRINRGQPLFQSPGVDRPAQPLLDQRVGRELLTLSAAGDRWRLERTAGRCRVRIDGREHQSPVMLEAARLMSGVVILLANSVLLHLRLEAHSVPDSDVPVPGLLGVGPAARRLRRQIHQAAGRATDVLLLGPSGSGKEVAAQAIHQLAGRRGAPWVPVNMSALTPELAAAELFGARKGAFTGALRDRPGYFQQAAGGTLFLDEIGDAPARVQPLLLRALQQREIQVIGGAVERVALRVIAATEVDPDDRARGFRASLRYRLGACEIRMPAVGERVEDIGVIAAHALRESLGARGVHWHSALLEPREVARWARCFESLLLRDWPGNIRELLHRLQDIAALSDAALRVPDGLFGDSAAAAPSSVSPPTGPERRARSDAAPVRRSAVDFAALSDAEFRAVWCETCGEVTAIAERYGVSRGAVYRRRSSVAGCRLAKEVPEAELRAALRRSRGDVSAAARRLTVSAAGLRARLGDAEAAPWPPEVDATDEGGG